MFISFHSAVLSYFEHNLLLHSKQIKLKVLQVHRPVLVNLVNSKRGKRE